MSSRRFTYFTTENAGLIPLADRLFNEYEISDCDRLIWEMAGFGPYAATSHIRLGATAEQARFLRGHGGDSSDFARFEASGGTPTELCEILKKQLPSPPLASRDSPRPPPPSRLDLVGQLVQIPPWQRTEDWSRLLMVISPELAPVVEHLIANDLDSPEHLARCVLLQSSARFQKFADMLHGGTLLAETDWVIHFPRPAHRAAWQVAGISCAEAVRRHTFSQRPLDIYEGAGPLDSFRVGRHRLDLHVCNAPFAVWRRDGGYVHPGVINLLRTNGIGDRRTLDTIGHYGYRVREHLAPDLADFGVGDQAGASLAEYGDSAGAAAILRSLHTPQEAANVMRREQGTDAIFRTALDHPIAVVRAAAASRGSHLPDLMVRAACDPIRQIRAIAAASVFTPLQVLQDLTRDRSQEVRIEAEMNLSFAQNYPLPSPRTPNPEANQ